MCDAETCSELGTDPSQWSVHALIPRPAWVLAELTPFADSVKAAAIGDIERARTILSSVRSEALQEWYLVHAAFAGRVRKRTLSIDSNAPSPGPKLPQPGKRLMRRLLSRDHYRCRYCETPIVPDWIMKDFGVVIGDESFLTSFDFPRPGVVVRHGAVQAYRANFDHVVPAWRGGQTDEANLVSSCWFCNFGKRRWTLEQLGLADPRDRAPIPLDSWTGLNEFSTALARAAKTIRHANAG